MVGKIIRDYIEGGARKLTVPGFGTFMRRDGGSGEVIFVDLLRGDDGALSEMVEDTGRHNEVEAMALIDRFIFEIKNTIERNGSATIEGFGTMTLDHKGVYQFHYSPSAKPAKENAVQEKLFQAQPTQKPKLPTPRPQSDRPQPQRRSTMRKPQRKGAGSSRTDTVIVVAIVAAAIALVAMIFGLSSAGNMPFLSK